MMRLWILCVSLSVLVSCGGQGPVVSACLMEPENNRLICVDGYTEKPFILPFEEAENFACFSPDDVRKILSALKRAGQNRVYQISRRKLSEVQSWKAELSNLEVIDVPPSL